MGRHYRTIASAGELDLYKVVTLREAAQMWRLHYKSLYYAIDAGLIVGRKSCGTWLISVASMINRYGQPKHSLN